MLFLFFHIQSQRSRGEIYPVAKYYTTALLKKRNVFQPAVDTSGSGSLWELEYFIAHIRTVKMWNFTIYTRQIRIVRNIMSAVAKGLLLGKGWARIWIKIYTANECFTVNSNNHAQLKKAII